MSDYKHRIHNAINEQILQKLNVYSSLSVKTLRPLNTHRNSISDSVRLANVIELMNFH